MSDSASHQPHKHPGTPPPDETPTLEHVMECAEKREWCGSEHARVLLEAVKELQGWKRNAEKGMGSDKWLPEEMYKLELEAQLTWDTAIEEAGKERIVFIAKKDILFMDNDMKVRKQMRNEIVKALQKLKAEAVR